MAEPLQTVRDAIGNHGRVMICGGLARNVAAGLMGMNSPRLRDVDLVAFGLPTEEAFLQCMQHLLPGGWNQQ